MPSRATISNMLACLDSFEAGKGITVPMVQHRSGLHSSVVYVVLRSLVAEGYLTRHQTTRCSHATYLITTSGLTLRAKERNPARAKQQQENAASLLARCMGYHAP